MHVRANSASPSGATRGSWPDLLVLAGQRGGSRPSAAGVVIVGDPARQDRVQPALNSPTDVPSNAEAIALAIASETTSSMSVSGEQASPVDQVGVVAEDGTATAGLHGVVAAGRAQPEGRR